MPALTVRWGAEGGEVEDEHIEQADGEADRRAAGQDAQEHRPWPPVLDQQQVEGQQFGIQRRDEASRKKVAFMAGQPASQHPAAFGAAVRRAREPS